jgi:hypothetical protein
MDRLKTVGIPMLGLVAAAALVIAMLPGRPDGPRAQAGANQPAATEAGALSNLCAGWGRARLDCAAFVTHFMTTLAERDPALSLCTPTPANLADWTVTTLRGTPPDSPWAPTLEAALTTGRTAHPLPCPPPAAAPAQKAEPT